MKNKPLDLHMMFTNADGKVAQCLKCFGGEIAYVDEPGVENDKRMLRCLKCGWYYAQIEITECNLTEWE